MANHGFGITAQQINKLIGTEWSEDTRINCFMAASIAELPDTKAYAKFVSLLNALGIKSANHTKISKDQYADTFTYGGEASSKLSEDDMRKVCAAELWKDMDVNTTYVMLAGVTGKALVDMYDKYSDKSKVKIVIHRIVIGQNTIYRVCPDTVALDSIIADALRYVSKPA